MSKEINADSVSVKKVAAIISASPGIESPAIAAAAGYTLSYTKNVLQTVSRLRIAGHVHMPGARIGWMPEEQARPLKEAHAMEVDGRRRMIAAARAGKQPSRRETILAMAATEAGVSARRVREELKYPANAIGKHCPSLIRLGLVFKSEREGCWSRWFSTAERAQAWAKLPPMEPSESSQTKGKVWDQRGRTSEATQAARVAEAAAREAKRKAEPKAPKLVAIGERLKNKTRQPSKAPPLLAGSQKNRKPNEVIRAKPGTDATVTLHGKATDMRGAVDYSRAKITICPAPVSIYRHQYDPGSEAHRAYVRQIEQLRGAA